MQAVKHPIEDNGFNRIVHTPAHALKHGTTSSSA
jgi:hypothetical protein